MASLNALPVEAQEQFRKLAKDGSDLARDGKMKKAIKKCTTALQIFQSEKLKKRIEKMEAFLAQFPDSSDDEEDTGTFEIDGLVLPSKMKKLYTYQFDGLRWMRKIHRQEKGGILGDDMGLGKTIQVIGFLSGLFGAKEIKSCLIIMPSSLISIWQKEFKKWASEIPVYDYHCAGNANQRTRNLRTVQMTGGVLLSTYGLLPQNYNKLNKTALSAQFTWDYVILDEAHKIKNVTSTTKAAHAIPAKHRIALSGTPLQNNLRELFALLDFVHKGTLLGSYHTFRNMYEIPITRARKKDCTEGQKRQGLAMANHLKDKIKPYFFRRTKQEVLMRNPFQTEIETSGTENSGERLGRQMVEDITRKNEFIVWVYLSERQLQVYRDFLKTEEVQHILMTTRSPLVQLTVLKKICDHLRLLSKKACAQLGLDAKGCNLEIEDEEEEKKAKVLTLNHVRDETLIEESGKLAFLLVLLQNLKDNGHRVLVFSLSRRMLDIIERILTHRGWRVMRVDGTVTNLQERAQRIQMFQEDRSYTVFLLTTQVGGVGLTLTAADRVVIFDPSWNPATDAQAVDRAYRLGQTKDVVVYRLITCGTVEEKIYRRQIFKDSLTKQITGGQKNPSRYFYNHELRELFTLEDHRHSTTQVQLQEMHGGQRKSDPTLDSHISFLHSQDIFGISDHDLMFSLQHNLNEEGCDGENEWFIQKQVETAERQVQREVESLERISPGNSNGFLFRGIPNPRSSGLFDREPLSSLGNRFSFGSLGSDDDDDDGSNSDDYSLPDVQDIFSKPKVGTKPSAILPASNGVKIKDEPLDNAKIGSLQSFIGGIRQSSTPMPAPGRLGNHPLGNSGINVEYGISPNLPTGVPRNVMPMSASSGRLMSNTQNTLTPTSSYPRPRASLPIMPHAFKPSTITSADMNQSFQSSINSLKDHLVKANLALAIAENRPITTVQHPSNLGTSQANLGKPAAVPAKPTTAQQSGLSGKYGNLVWTSKTYQNLHATRNITSTATASPLQTTENVKSSSSTMSRASQLFNAISPTLEVPNAAVKTYLGKPLEHQKSAKTVKQFKSLLPKLPMATGQSVEVSKPSNTLWSFKYSSKSPEPAVPTETKNQSFQSSINSLKANLEKAALVTSNPASKTSIYLIQGGVGQRLGTTASYIPPSFQSLIQNLTTTTQPLNAITNGPSTAFTTAISKQTPTIVPSRSVTLEVPKPVVKIEPSATIITVPSSSIILNVPKQVIKTEPTTLFQKQAIGNSQSSQLPAKAPSQKIYIDSKSLADALSSVLANISSTSADKPVNIEDEYSPEVQMGIANTMFGSLESSFTSSSFVNPNTFQFTTSTVGTSNVLSNPLVTAANIKKDPDALPTERFASIEIPKTSTNTNFVPVTIKKEPGLIASTATTSKAKKPFSNLRFPTIKKEPGLFPAVKEEPGLSDSFLTPSTSGAHENPAISASSDNKPIYVLDDDDPDALPSLPGTPEPTESIISDGWYLPDFENDDCIITEDVLTSDSELPQCKKLRTDF